MSAETLDEFMQRAGREMVRIVGDGWHVTLGRNPRDWRGREPRHPWKIVDYQSARSLRTGGRQAASHPRKDRRGAWNYRRTLDIERQLPDGAYVYDFPDGTRVSGAKLYPLLEWVLSTPDWHPHRHLPVDEINRVLRHGGPPTAK